MLGNCDEALQEEGSVTPINGARVLLIGGAGFLGQHLSRACCLAKMKVRIADVVLPQVCEAKPDVEYLQGDYRDPAFLRRIVDGADFVIHLAHDTILLDPDHNMDIEFERNIRPAMRLMDACSALAVTKLLFVSSGGTVYGNPASHEPISENTRTNPISLYGTTKLMIEQIGFLNHKQNGLPFVVARPANAYGPGQQPFRGQGFVATAFASVLEDRSLNIFGDGSVIRDYIHARDIADAFLALLQYGVPGEVYNVGTACGISLKSLLDEYISPIVGEDGFKLCCKYTPARNVDVVYNVVANDKLCRDAGFAARISLSEGLRETWNWLKKLYGHVHAK
jgi:UDP-glucose 4-epimerase